MKIFFSVGEPSGDLHGANLIRDLRALHPQVECVGYGGPRMAASGCQLHEDLTQLAVMGLSRIPQHIPKFWHLYRQADRYFRGNKVDAVVLIDYPGFNWWIAGRAKAHGIPVFYYGPPQMWAWAPWRVRKLRRLVDHVLCKLPFEEKWYRQRGCQATYVGHPYFDETQRHSLDEYFLTKHADNSRRLVTILPGSRTQEVVGNMPWFLHAAKIVRQAVPDARFAVASFNQRQARIARDEIASAGIDAEVFIGRTPELIHLADCCMACSGSVSLELLHHLKPTVIQYRLNRGLWLAKALLLRVKYITLVNLLATDDIQRVENGRHIDPDSPAAERIPFPEYPTCSDPSDRVASHIVQWLTDGQQRSARIRQLAQLKAKYGQPGASKLAAQHILRTVCPSWRTLNQSPVAA